MQRKQVIQVRRVETLYLNTDSADTFSLSKKLKDPRKVLVLNDINSPAAYAQGLLRSNIYEIITEDRV